MGEPDAGGIILCVCLIACWITQAQAKHLVAGLLLGPGCQKPILREYGDRQLMQC